MATVVIDYILPAMHFVCHLVALGNNSVTSFNVTSPVPVAPQLQPSPQPVLKARRPPDGYTTIPDIGFAYKFHDIRDTELILARIICLTEGAQLAVLDSAEKMNHIRSLASEEFDLHAGIVRLDDMTWVDVNTGVPVTSIIWARGEPSGSGQCLYFDKNSFGLRNYKCVYKTSFFCEFEITANSTTAIN